MLDTWPLRRGCSSLCDELYPNEKDGEGEGDERQCGILFVSRTFIGEEIIFRAKGR